MLLTHQSIIVPAFRSPAYFGTMMYTAIVITVITFFLFQWALQHVPASTASLKEYIQLIVGIGLNGIILGEAFTIHYFLGSVFVVIGVLIATSQHLTRRLASVLFSRGD
jgi:drug/metabolite transporter (DMT)-like permease